MCSILKDKKVLVTGGSRGIGRAVALEAAENGADVAIIYSGNVKKAEETAEEIRKRGRKAWIYKCDVAEWKEVSDTVKKIADDMGGIDVVVNNAGITRDRMLLMMKEEDFDSVISVNLKGAFNMTRHAAKIMVKNRKGSIVNISSVSGLMGNPGQINYASAKAGLVGMTKTSAKELARAGIRCNAIAPGFVATDMTEEMSSEAKETMSGMIPLGRAADPSEIAKAAVFLASDQASYITGEILKVDGGMYI